MMLFSGCNSGAISSTKIADAQSSYDEALAKLSSGEMQGALSAIEQSLAAGGLNPDLYASALLVRAECYVAANRIDDAASDLQTAEQGAPDEARLHYVRGLILNAQGDSTGAKREFSAAKRLDRSLKTPL
ncbi:MAG: tetratricopeptide repeat protein [Planctomycetales bacterium]|nr:tetratricopeptide repeat protein [Planctomycetales bacterium]